MKKIYILYRPVLDYEESETSYLACETREQAEKVRAEIISECNKIAANIHEWTALKSTKFPYGLSDLAYDMENIDEWSWEKGDHIKSRRFNENALSIMELPIV